jgi:hypothetical protein
MTTDGGGWTMVLNLNTSDGHVMWWGNELWTNSDTYGDASDPWTSDHKGEAWNQFAGATGVLLVVHEDGSYRGWKHFDKANGDTMYAHFQGGDNTPLADAVVAADIRNVWTGEWLVNRSTALYANHCIPHDGSCTSGSAGSPDGDRIASHESAPTNNRGGGLGNWHDMSYCCSGTLAGKTCNGGSIRTASEAQAGWCSSYYAPNNGHFGSDSYFPATCVMDDGDCGSAAWSEANGFDYDYALFLREDNCGDDTLNGNETDVDCGGVCGRCSSGETCVHGNDCLSGTCDAGSCTATYQPTCQAILFALSDARDGVYTIDPDGTEGSMEPFNVFCDMTTAGGGWTVVERSPLGNAIGRALYQDYPVDEDAPESRRHRLSRARVDAVESLSDELYLHCGGGDFLKTASSYLYGGEDGSYSCGDNDLIGYDEAQLKGNLLRGVTLCTWYMGATEGCTGAFHIDESAQLVYCGLDNFPWTGSAITTPSADAFAMDTETRDVTEPLADCHLPGAVRHVMLRGRCSVDGEVNNDETDTDCGGSCPGCAAGLSCTNDGDCASYNCDGGTCGAPAASCLDILTADAAAPDGLYIIDIDGDGAGAPREVYCDMTTDGGGWTRLVYEDFESTTTGWSLTNTTTTCGRYGNILGGYNQTANGSNGKTYDLAGLSHTEARVELDYIKIDSWDPTEFAYLQIDGVEQYRANLPDGAPICGASSPGWHERRVHLDYTVDHTATTIEVRPGMVANQGPQDESWGVDNVEVWVR